MFADSKDTDFLGAQNTKWCLKSNILFYPTNYYTKDFRHILTYLITIN